MVEVPAYQGIFIGMGLLYDRVIYDNDATVIIRIHLLGHQGLGRFPDRTGIEVRLSQKARHFIVANREVESARHAGSGGILRNAQQIIRIMRQVAIYLPKIPYF